LLFEQEVWAMPSINSEKLFERADRALAESRWLKVEVAASLKCLGRTVSQRTSIAAGGAAFLRPSLSVECSRLSSR
jgi:hypothetical protein